MHCIISIPCHIKLAIGCQKPCLMKEPQRSNINSRRFSARRFELVEGVTPLALHNRYLLIGGFLQVHIINEDMAVVVNIEVGLATCRAAHRSDVMLARYPPPP